MNSLLRITGLRGSCRAERRSVAPRSAALPDPPSSPMRHSGDGLPEDDAALDRYVLTRPEFAHPALVRRPVVLLTGAWPYDSSQHVVELDSTLDCRFARLDRQAECLSQRAGREPLDCRSALPSAWVNCLGLRYHLVRLLRVIEYFSSVQPPERGERLCLMADRTDADDVAIITAMCRRAGAECLVRWRGDKPQEELSITEPEEWWRRSMRRLADGLSLPGRTFRAGPRVVLCGNPRFLDPVCQVLHERRCRIWWLYDRFAVKPFFRWHIKGVPQLTCQDAPHREGEPEDDRIDLPPLPFQGIDLRPFVLNWLGGRLAARRRDQRRWHEQIDRHFRRIRPDLLVMDEDATPMKRIALAVARRYGGKSFVIQHGAPIARFGFAPLAADGIFVWGLSTLEQLERWGVPKEKVFVTGSPCHSALGQSLRRSVSRRVQVHRSPRILLLATVPPRDCRPDLVELNLNSRSYAEMIEAAFAAAGALDGATLVIKPHPRTRTDQTIDEAMLRHPNLPVEVVRSRSLEESLRGIDCVLSCLSSAGIEATLADIPVIQLVPRGAGQILPFDRWGLDGSAASAAELLPLLQKALSGQRPSGSTARRAVFADASFSVRGSSQAPDSAARIADILLDQAKPDTTAPRSNEEQGSSPAFANC